MHVKFHWEGNATWSFQERSTNRAVDPAGSFFWAFCGIYPNVNHTFSRLVWEVELLAQPMIVSPAVIALEKRVWQAQFLVQNQEVRPCLNEWIWLYRQDQKTWAKLGFGVFGRTLKTYCLEQQLLLCSHSASVPWPWPLTSWEANQIWRVWLSRKN